jgi:F-type H+-transporting ATPase subunit alpha
VGISVSRVGGAAQTKLIKKVSGSVKLDLAQYYELEAFSQFASELDAATKAQLTRGKRVVEALKQGQNQPLTLWQEAFVLYSATKGYLDTVEADEVQPKMKSLYALVESSHGDLVKEIESKKELSAEIESGMKALIEKFFNN